VVNGKMKEDKGGTSLQFRLHHALGDGSTFVALLLTVIDQDLPVWKKSKKEPKSLAEKVLMGLRFLGSCAYLPVEMKEQLKHDPETIFSTLADLPRETRRTNHDFSVPLAEIKEIKNKVGVTVNDLMFTLIARTVRLYMLKFGPPQDIKATVPINLRMGDFNVKDANQAGNKICFAAPPVLAAEPSVERCLAKTKIAFDYMKNSPILSINLLTIKLLGKFWGSMSPETMNTITADQRRGQSMLFTNVPGPQQGCSIAGCALEEINFFVQPDYAKLWIMAISYDGNCRISTSVLPSCVDQEFFKTCMEEAMEQLRKIDVEKAKEEIASQSSAREKFFLVLGGVMVFVALWFTVFFVCGLLGYFCSDLGLRVYPRP